MYDFKTRREACEQWVKEFTHIPQEVLVKLKELNIDDVNQITPIAVGMDVKVGYGDDCGLSGVVLDIDDDIAEVKLLNGRNEKYDKYGLIFREDDYDDFPMWTTMWAFTDYTDNEWLENHGGIQKMAELGFRLYEQEDFGIVFGIDQAGISFFERFWIPLYEARGLKWSDEDCEDESD